jgi:hypothetical protein
MEMFNTRIAKVRGFMAVRGEGAKPMKIIVRFTSDHGETLSLADENDRIMLTVKFEEVERLIRRTRCKR